MGRSLIKLTDPRDGQAHYLEWSSVVDAPVVVFADFLEMAAYYRDEYGRLRFEQEWEETAARIEQKGTSSRRYDSAEEQVAENRAGAHEQCLTVTELIDRYWPKEEPDGGRTGGAAPEAGP